MRNWSAIVNPPIDVSNLFYKIHRNNHKKAYGILVIIEKKMNSQNNFGTLALDLEVEWLPNFSFDQLYCVKMIVIFS